MPNKMATKEKFNPTTPSCQKIIILPTIIANRLKQESMFKRNVFVLSRLLYFDCVKLTIFKFYTVRNTKMKKNITQTIISSQIDNKPK